MEREYTEADIKVLKPLEHIRKRPSMYGFDLNTPQTKIKLLFQVLSFGLDTLVSERNLKINVTASQRQVSIRYDAGFAPLINDDEAIENCFLRFHRPYIPRKRALAVEYCDPGLPYLVAFCESLSVKLCCDGRFIKLDFYKCELENPKNHLQETSEPDYSEFTARLDPELFDDPTFDLGLIETEVEILRLRLPNLSVSMTFDHLEE